MLDLQEDLQVALAWTYAEFKKSSSQADALEKQFKESQVARQLEAAEAMREWKAKLEASQGICKARALRINELEVNQEVQNVWSMNMLSHFDIFFFGMVCRAEFP